MKKIPFSENELKVVGEIPGFFPEMPDTPIYDFPISPKEAYIATMKRDPIWQVTTVESQMFNPCIIPDNIARAIVIEANPLAREDFGGKDMFGIEWEYVEIATGSIVKPGSPLLSDANEWEEKVVFPNVDSWDWEGSGKSNEKFIDHNRFIIPFFLTGFFERLISFMDFDGAIMALVDEDQQDAVKALFEKLTDTYIHIIDNMIKYHQIDGITIHDDWGSQRAPFFSPKTAMEMIVPAMKRLTDHIHSKGLYADLHSCGHLEMQVPSMIAAGWDSWTPQEMNDIPMLFEKYGDRIVLGAIPDPIEPDASEEEQRAAAERFVERFCRPGKAATISFYGMMALTPSFREELYKLSRIKYGQ